jgi:hypothetical protein
MYQLARSTSEARTLCTPFDASRKLHVRNGSKADIQ